MTARGVEGDRAHRTPPIERNSCFRFRPGADTPAPHGTLTCTNKETAPIISVPSTFPNLDSRDSKLGDWLQSCFSTSLGFHVLSKKAFVGPYRRKITKYPFPGSVFSQFFPAPGESGPK